MAFATETDLRYPIGKYERPESLTDDQRRASIAQIEEAPAKMRAAVAGLNDQQLDTPYRPGGWTAGLALCALGLAISIGASLRSALALVIALALAGRPEWARRIPLSLRHLAGTRRAHP